MPVWLGVCLFIVASLGYTGVLRLLGVNAQLSWITAILIQILILYGFAMAGLLRFGIWFMLALGWLSFGGRWLTLLLGKGKLPYEGLQSYDLWFAIMGVIMAVVLWQSPLIHYDNYSHWALIVKFLFYTGHLPGAADTIISFTSYPPALALFLTAFVTLAGFGAGPMLVAQFMVIWAALYTVFGLLRDRSRVLMAMILCFVVALTNVFNIAIRFNNLLVDFVLPALTLAGIAGVFLYRRHWRWQCFHVFLVSASLLLVKNSGAFFVAVIGFYFIYQLIRTSQGCWWQRTLKVLGTSVSTMVLAAVPFLIWNYHVKHTFTASKHEISSQAYSHQLSGESTQTILRIVHKFVTHILSWQSLATKGFILINVTLLVAWLVIRLICKKKNYLLGGLVLLDVMAGLYYGSVLAMYLVSMPYAEAIALDGLERYLSSIIVLNLLLGAVLLVRAMDLALFEQNITQRNLRSFRSLLTKNIYQFATFGLLIFSIIMLVSESDGIAFTNHLNRNELPLQLARISPQWTHLSQKRVLLVDPHKDDVATYYAGYIAHYYYFTNQAVARENFMMSAADFRQEVAKYQYVVIPEFHSTFSTMVRKIYHQQVRTGLYRVTARGLVKIS